MLGSIERHPISESEGVDLSKGRQYHGIKKGLGTTGCAYSKTEMSFDARTRPIGPYYA